MCLIRVGTPSALFTALSPAPYPQHPSQDIYISCIYILYIYICTRRKEAWKEKMFLVSHFLSDLRRSASMAFSLGWLPSLPSAFSIHSSLAGTQRVPFFASFFLHFLSCFFFAFSFFLSLFFSLLFSSILLFFLFLYYFIFTNKGTEDQKGELPDKGEPDSYWQS